LLTGAGDPDSRAHGANESVDLRDLERACLAEALFLRNLAP
jgi:cysteinylglycine-S-conjugate dipeptidase